VWYVNGTGIDLTPDRSFGQKDDFTQDWTQRQNFSPDEFLRWSIGMNSYSVYRDKLDHAYNALGSTPGDILLHGFERTDTITPLKKEWEDYLEWTETQAPAGQKSFKDLYETWQKSRYGSDVLTLTDEQEAALELKEALGNAASLFTEGGIRNGDYRAVSGVASEAIGSIDFPESQSAIGKGISWWWENVGDPYGNQVSKLYDRLDNVSNPFDRAKIYEELRGIANNAKPQTYNGEKLPTPEQVFFNNMSPEEQKARRLKWASLPVEWLTNFQMQQIGLKPSPKLEELATFINQNETAFDYTVASNDISTSSNEYERLRAAFDNRAIQKANQLGLQKEYTLMQQPTYKRLDELQGKTFHSPTWNTFVRQADEISKRIEAAGYSPGGTSDIAKFYQGWLVNEVRAARENDERFDAVMTDLERTFAPSGKDSIPPDLLTLKLFFSYYGDTAPGYIYTKGS